MSGTADLFAMERLDDDYSAERTSNKALAEMYQAVPNEIKTKIVFHAAFEQCLDNELPVNLALVCTDWFKIIQDQMQVGQPCFKAWYGAIGHEDIYETFLKGVLLYRPIPNSDEGMIKLNISDLKDTSPEGTPYKLLKKNPLEGIFDLPTCGDAGKYLVISTGYRKGINPDNKGKAEVWISPRFMIEKKIANAHHFKEIVGNWDEKVAPLGVFYTWSADTNEYFDYCTSKDLNVISKNDLYTIWGDESACRIEELCGACSAMRGRGGRTYYFTFHFEPK
ncbi:MAG: hypothetical protein H0X26_08775 [Alphaproteobacteria bacterium]|nr:hypothetical protein [Alphaproteobacteria bacterium]